MSHQLRLGILREVKSTWERRVPLVPSAVQQLIKQHNIQVIVQPSTSRVYTDQQYKDVGAIIDNDLSKCNSIIGVKEQQPSTLLTNKSYMMFNHVIKAQPYNMPLLDHCLNNNIRLFDYECIRSSQPPHNRLVAFGIFAGYAGMIDTLRGIGERYLSLGYSTPFLHIGSSYMYPTLNDAIQAVKHVGKLIQQYGLPNGICPLTFVFTGNGNVSQGAQYIFNLLPHKYIQPNELKTLSSRDNNILYASIVNAEHMVERIDIKQSTTATKFDKQHYYLNPHLYHSIADQTIIPYTSVLMNCMYWDAKYPRLLTIDQLKSLRNNGNQNLQVIGDISCDINGSIEFTTKSTTIDQPYYLYDIYNNTVNDKIDNTDGILIMSIDCLPTEFATDASIHFSNALLPFMTEFIQSDHNKLFLSTAKQYMSHELYNSCIVADNKLTPNYQYIDTLRKSHEKAIQSNSTTTITLNTNEQYIESNILLSGHLFDTGYINASLDIIEQTCTNFRITNWSVNPNRQRKDSISQCVINVTCIDNEQLDLLIKQLKQLSTRMPSSKTTIELLNNNNSSNYNNNYNDTVVNNNSNNNHYNTTKQSNRILILGSGYVAAPTVEYLSRKQYNNIITIASNVLTDAENIIKYHSHNTNNVNAIELDINNINKLTNLIKSNDIVISLLPATMHIDVAKLCIEYKKHLVTASYVSQEMRNLHNAALQSNVLLLNEIGLDPGLDHMSAMSIIDELHNKGSKIIGFTSLCGGLPANDSCDNPLNYKFSWSPLGVLNATQHAAIYKKHGQNITIQQGHILQYAQSTNIFDNLKLEYIANRDSLSYIDVYNLSHDTIQTMYRGTLRYNGFSQLMYCLIQLGLLNNNIQTWINQNTTYADIICYLLQCKSNNIQNAIYDKLHESNITDNVINNVIDTCNWLGLTSNQRIIYNNNNTTIFNIFCTLLQHKLQYTTGQRDMIAMHHTIDIEHKYGNKETITSSLLVYGGQSNTIQNNNNSKLYMPGGGLNGYSAMSRTVGLPVAIATQLILDKQIKRTGCVIPTHADIYKPVLELLKQEGIEHHEQYTEYVDLFNRNNIQELIHA